MEKNHLIRGIDKCGEVCYKLCQDSWVMAGDALYRGAEGARDRVLSVSKLSGKRTVVN